MRPQARTSQVVQKICIAADCRIAADRGNILGQTDHRLGRLGKDRLNGYLCYRQQYSLFPCGLSIVAKLKIL